MSDIKARARLRPRTTSVLDAMAAKVTADDVAEPDKDISNVSQASAGTDIQSDGVSQTSASNDIQGNGVSQTPDTQTNQLAEDDWLSQLTIPEPVQPDTTQSEVSQQVSQPTQPEITAPADTAATQALEDLRKAELAKRFESLSTVDPEVAEELYNSVFAPTLEEQIKQLRETELAEMRKKVEAQEQYYKNIQLQSRQSISDKVDAEITQKYPREQAAKILHSVEFSQFLDSELPPYASENGYDILKRAYAAGDSSYVISAMDRFKSSRAKPKPQVSADVSSGGTQVVDGNGVPKKLTQAQYMSERKKIMSAPRGTYPPDALSKLAEQFLKGA